MRSILLFFMLFLGGCIAGADEKRPAVVTVPVSVNDKSVLRNQPGPPDIELYPNILVNRKVLFQYLDDLNWWMFSMYSYLRTANNYGKEFGWVSPTWLPLCRYWVPPKLPVLPPFVIDLEVELTPEEFEWAMANYITELKLIYNTSVKIIDDEHARQRALCLY